MRTGAIFARGSCRALKWMALFGVVFTLGAGAASAQVTVKLAEEVTEGDVTGITVTAKVAVPEGIAAGEITVTATEASPVAGEFQVEENDVVISQPALVLAYPAGPANDDDPDTDLITKATLTGTITVQAVQGRRRRGGREDLHHLRDYRRRRYYGPGRWGGWGAMSWTTS